MRRQQQPINADRYLFSELFVLFFQYLKILFFGEGFFSLFLMADCSGIASILPIIVVIAETMKPISSATLFQRTWWRTRCCGSRWSVCFVMLFRFFITVTPEISIV